jgi:hypothetical protein
LNLKCDILVSNVAFKWVNLYRYTLAHTAPLGQLCVEGQHSRACVSAGAPGGDACAFCIIERHIAAALATDKEDGGGGSNNNNNNNRRYNNNGYSSYNNGNNNSYGGGGGTFSGGYPTAAASFYGGGGGGSFDDAMSPNEVFRNLHLLARHFVRGRQEDAHELLRLSLEAMDKSCLRNCGRPLVGGGAGTTPGPERALPPTVGGLYKLFYSQLTHRA